MSEQFYHGMTVEEFTEWLAVNVMGWHASRTSKLYKSSLYHAWHDSDNRYVMWYEQWNPLTSWNSAMGLRNHVAKKYRGTPEHGWWVDFSDRLKQMNLGLVEPSDICNACYEAFKEIPDD